MCTVPGSVSVSVLSLPSSNTHEAAPTLWRYTPPTKSCGLEQQDPVTEALLKRDDLPESPAGIPGDPLHVVAVPWSLWSQSGLWC